MGRPPRRAGHVAVGVAVLVAACGADRPTATDWAGTWDAARRRVPAAEALLAAGPDGCDALVGDLRAVEDELEPSPTEALDSAVGAWLDHAESIAFDCPDDAAELAARYDALDVLAIEVDAGLAAAS